VEGVVCILVVFNTASLVIGRNHHSSNIYYCLRKLSHCVRFKFLTVVVMNSSVFWGMKPWPASIMPSRWFLTWFVFRSLRLRRHFPQTRRLTFQGTVRRYIPKGGTLCYILVYYYFIHEDCTSKKLSFDQFLIPLTILKWFVSYYGINMPCHSLRSWYLLTCRSQARLIHVTLNSTAQSCLRPSL
jgi:hypothetical protein